MENNNSRRMVDELVLEAIKLTQSVAEDDPVKPISAHIVSCSDPKYWYENLIGTHVHLIDVGDLDNYHVYPYYQGSYLMINKRDIKIEDNEDDLDL